MAEVKILIQGYACEDAGGHSCSAIVLIKDKGLNIIVDPGTAKSQELIKEKLKEQGLAINDINFIIITHSHIDHYMNIGMFPKAKVLDFWGIWEGDVWNKRKDKLTKDIEIIKTLGHNYDCISVLVNTEKGKIAIVGDVFWWTDKEEQKTDKESLLAHKDPYVKNQEQLMQSRKKLLELADYIIPGHGKMFKTK